MIEMDGPVIVGSIGDDGLMTIDMTPAEGDDARPSAAVFGCGRLRDVNVSTPAATFSVSDLSLVRMAGEKYVGDVHAFSSPEFGAARLKAMGSGNTTQEPGARYRLMYVSEPVSIEGTCSTEFWVDGGAGPAFMQVEEYDVDLDSGWQLLKTFTRDTVTSNLGVTFRSIPSCRAFHWMPARCLGISLLSDAVPRVKRSPHRKKEAWTRSGMRVI